MGNAIGNGREEKWDSEYEGEGSSIRSREGFSEITSRSWRAESSDSIESMNVTALPDITGRSRSPYLFSPQIPLAPLRTDVESSSNNHNLSLNSNHDTSDLPWGEDEGVPTVVTWSFGGNKVEVVGSWDNWTSRKTLTKSGNEHSLMLVLGNGVYYYRFIVDGDSRYITNEPYVADDAGRCMNILDVNDYIPENLKAVDEFNPPHSPDSSYSRLYPVEFDSDKVPVHVPELLLNQTILGYLTQDDESMKPEHVNLNHLFIEKGCVSQNMVALGVTHRFRSKYVTVALHKSLN